MLQERRNRTGRMRAVKMSGTFVGGIHWHRARQFVCGGWLAMKQAPKRRVLYVVSIALFMTLVGPRASGQNSPVAFVGLGDSIGEGVQSADASQFTQPFSFLN